jgi:uncharacterized membrane protein
MTEDVENSKIAERNRGVMSYQEIVDAWHRRPISNQVGSRRRRRRLVIGTFVGWLLITAVAKLISLASPGWFLTLMVLMMANSIIQLIWLSPRTYINAPKLADAELDERLVQIKNRAFRRAYAVVVPVALTAWWLSLLAVTQQPGNEGQTNALLIFFGVAMLATTLPTAIVAWSEPDPEP